MARLPLPRFCSCACHRLSSFRGLIDRAIDKLLVAEIEQARVERRDLEARLSAYEEQYGMTSEEVYRRFRAGGLGDGMDFVEWSVFYEMYQAILQRLKEG